ncbi:hypothetical protein [Streptomyces chartreusis]|uniref:hypothetical protein n=1 Tax=Streptomyces chartreusis TaxID=1969 RepID=UPI002E803612|nr:hypothetical protein [Streptomyces chartreusis]WUB18326.1 hypothetical protein OG997_17070 [Streptomyces chartreusis]
MFLQCTPGNAPAKRPCDFCVHPAAAWSYPCRTIIREVVEGLQVIMAGPWHACAPCHRLIAAGKWAELRRRSLRLYRATHRPLTRAADTAIAADLAPLLHQFRTHRTGPAERIGGAS